MLRGEITSYGRHLAVPVEGPRLRSPARCPDAGAAPGNEPTVNWGRKFTLLGVDMVTETASLLEGPPLG